MLLHASKSIPPEVETGTSVQAHSPLHGKGGYLKISVCVCGKDNILSHYTRAMPVSFNLES